MKSVIFHKLANFDNWHNGLNAVFQHSSTDVKTASQIEVDDNGTNLEDRFKYNA